MAPRNPFEPRFGMNHFRPEEFGRGTRIKAGPRSMLFAVLGASVAMACAIAGGFLMLRMPPICSAPLPRDIDGDGVEDVAICTRARGDTSVTVFNGTTYKTIVLSFEQRDTLVHDVATPPSSAPATNVSAFAVNAPDFIRGTAATTTRTYVLSGRLIRKLEAFDSATHQPLWQTTVLAGPTNVMATATRIYLWDANNHSGLIIFDATSGEELKRL